MNYDCARYASLHHTKADIEWAQADVQQFPQQLQRNGNLEMSPDLWYKRRATDQQWGKCPIATLRLHRFQRSTGVSKFYSILTELKWHHPPTTELSPTLWLALCSKELCLAGRRQYRHGRLQKASAVNLESCRVARSLEKLICFKGVILRLVSCQSTKGLFWWILLFPSFRSCF